MTNNEMELYAQMDSQVKTSGEVQKIKLKTTPRYLKDAVKGAGFTFNQSVAEFVDNSLDAKAKKNSFKSLPTT